MLNLVLVSSSALVSRHFEIGNAEILREIVGDIRMMRHVLVLDGKGVIFEAKRNESPEDEEWNVARLREILRKQEVLRPITEREMRALNGIRYKA